MSKNDIRVLIAEDSLEIANLLKDFLTARGFTVHLVDDGLQLARAAAELRPNLIISDIQMPRAYGSSAYRTLQTDAATKDIPIIFISAHPVAALMPKDPRVKFLQKPLDMGKLTSTIADLLSMEGPQP